MRPNPIRTRAGHAPLPGGVVAARPDPDSCGAPLRGPLSPSDRGPGISGPSDPPGPPSGTQGTPEPYAGPRGPIASPEPPSRAQSTPDPGSGESEPLYALLSLWIRSSGISGPPDRSDPAERHGDASCRKTIDPGGSRRRDPLSEFDRSDPSGPGRRFCPPPTRGTGSPHPSEWEGGKSDRGRAHAKNC